MHLLFAGCLYFTKSLSCSLGLDEMTGEVLVTSFGLDGGFDFEYCKYIEVAGSDAISLDEFSMVESLWKALGKILLMPKGLKLVE